VAHKHLVNLSALDLAGRWIDAPPWAAGKSIRATINELAPWPGGALHRAPPALGMRRVLITARCPGALSSSCHARLFRELHLCRWAPPLRPAVRGCARGLGCAITESLAPV
jgi:hypothetical protein